MHSPIESALGCVSERPPDRERYVLSPAESARIFREDIVPAEYRDLRPVEHPSTHFFGGQPGAGKSAAQRAVTEALVEADGPRSIRTIIGDEFRMYHPQYQRLLRDDDERAAFYTDEDSGRWVEQAIDLSLEARSHVILEGTLRNPNLTIDTANSYRDHGFATHLHVPAVSDLMSRQRIFQRYFGQIAESGTGRYTVREAHDRAYQALPGSLLAIADAQTFGSITMYDLDGQEILRTERGEPEAGAHLVECLNANRRVGPVLAGWILRQLDQYEELAQRLGREQVRRDVQELRVDVERRESHG